MAAVCRPGVSSGILLGAMTLPGLMLSRLIQMSRGLSLDLECLLLQYWTTSSSCFSVLLFLHVLLQRQDNSFHSVGSCCNWKMKVCLSCVALYAGVCCIAFSAKSHFGWEMVLIFLLVVFHGLAAEKVIQTILRTFPACASIGEALSVTSGLVIYLGDMLVHTAGKQ